MSIGNIRNNAVRRAVLILTAPAFVVAMLAPGAAIGITDALTDIQSAWQSAWRGSWKGRNPVRRRGGQ